jgi:hypothetical protein
MQFIDFRTRAAPEGLGTVDILLPTLRKGREGWGTRSFRVE